MQKLVQISPRLSPRPPPNMPPPLQPVIFTASQVQDGVCLTQAEAIVRGLNAKQQTLEKFVQHGFLVVRAATNLYAFLRRSMSPKPYLLTLNRLEPCV